MQATIASAISCASSRLRLPAHADRPGGTGDVTRAERREAVGPELAQRLQGRVGIGDAVRERDDLRHAPEVLPQVGPVAGEGDVAEVEQAGGGRDNAADRLVAKQLVAHREHRRKLEADGVRADLLVVADDHDLLAEPPQEQRVDAGLARLVDDDHVERIRRRRERLGDAVGRHDPGRNGRAALLQLPLGCRKHVAAYLPLPWPYLAIACW